MTDRFYDSTQPHEIPAGAAALLYKDGDYAWNGPTSRFSAVRWITVTGDYQQCGAVDWEKFNPVFSAAGLRGFVRGRRAMKARARVYCNMSTAAEALKALHDGGTLAEYGGLRWWIARPGQAPPTQAELAAELAQTWDAPIPKDQLWGCQYAWDGIYDESVLYLPW